MKTIAILYLVLSLFSTQIIKAQYTQQGRKFTGSGVTGTARQGSAVAFSADGGIAVIGGPGDDNGRGAVWIFINHNGTWEQQGEKLTASDSRKAEYEPNLGYSIAVSADGNTIAAGGPADSAGAGAVWIFERSNGNWQQKGRKLIAEDSVEIGICGSSVAISGDGNTVILSGMFENGESLGAWAFKRTNGTWEQDGGRLISVSSNSDPFHSTTVAISADGNTALFEQKGVEFADEGGIWILTRKNGKWLPETYKLIQKDSTYKLTWGINAAISADGSTIAAGGHIDYPGDSRVWIFQKADSIWKEQANFSYLSDAELPGISGPAVSISADGSRTAIGDASDSVSKGAVRIFSRSGSTWIQEGKKLIGKDVSRETRFGASIFLASDGNTLIAGGPEYNRKQGASWVFSRSNGIWQQTGEKIIGTGAGGAARFGASLGLSADGNTAIIGGTGDNNDLGAVWIFTRSDSEWTQQGDKLVGDGWLGNAMQGTSVALSADGSTAIIGGMDNFLMGSSAWIFTRQNGVWKQQGAKLQGNDAIGGLQANASVDLSADGNTAVLGGNEEGRTERRIGTGGFWVFTRANGKWSQQGPKLLVPGAYSQGYSVAIAADGNTIIEGAPNVNNERGGAWVFTRINGVWKQQGGMLADSAETGENLNQGTKVYISAGGDTAAVKGDTQLCFFKRTNGIWNQMTEKISLSISNELQFNPPAAISDDFKTAAVGNYNQNNYQGVIYILKKNNNEWTLQDSLTGTEGDSMAMQGASLAFSSDGRTLIESGYADKLMKGSVWVFHKTEIPVALISEEFKTIKFSLGQNYPNPFNPVTTITYSLPERSLVTVKVFDLLGREVSTLVSTEQSAGRYNLLFNAAALPSGIYIYTIQAGKFSSARKLIFLK